MSEYQTEYIDKLMSLWEELEHGEKYSSIFDWLEHESKCPAFPADWDNHFEDDNDWHEQPECECGYDEFTTKYFAFRRWVDSYKAKHQKRALRKSYKKVIDSRREYSQYLYD